MNADLSTPPGAPASILCMGGTFDPVHMAHLLLARDVAERHGFDEVLLIPAATSPHKRHRIPAAPAHRMAMIHAAIAREPLFRVWNGELERGGTSYTIDTARELQRLFPGKRLGWVMGADQLPLLHTWKDVEDLFNILEFFVLHRPGNPIPALTPGVLRLPESCCEKLASRICPARALDLSSSEIRERCACGLSIKYLVPGPVADYIAGHRLYAVE